MFLRCNVELPASECRYQVYWLIKAADKRMYACGKHIHMVCQQMLRTGVEYMTVTPNKE
jgi:hypothetical protein